jgi:hypothetical protein
MGRDLRLYVLIPAAPSHRRLVCRYNPVVVKQRAITTRSRLNESASVSIVRMFFQQLLALAQQVVLAFARHNILVSARRHKRAIAH